jgi:hypothetical protein
LGVGRYGCNVLLKQNGPEHTDLPAAKLFSLALNPAFSRREIAEVFYTELTVYFKQMQVAEFKIIVGARLVPAHKFYQYMCAQHLTELELHEGAKSVVYVQSANAIRVVDY